MNLKHKGTTVVPTLNKTEERQFNKVCDILTTLALLPCSQRAQANEALRILQETKDSLVSPQEETEATVVANEEDQEKE